MAKNQALSDVLKKKLWIVTGKGGVGKTTLTAALGLLAGKQGLRTLLVETHGIHHLGDVFGVGHVGYSGKRLKHNLDLIQITPEEAFEEYVLNQVRFRWIYNTVFNNKYVRHFIDAAPGLIELLTIGKIWSLVGGESEKWARRKPYDLVIVDAPSTGHGLSLLTVPEVVVSAVRVGPLKNKSLKILELLRDSTRTIIWLATLPEEMPVNEAVDLANKLETEVKVEMGPLLVNSLWPELLSESSRKELKRLKVKNPALDVYQKRLDQSRFYLDMVKSKLDGKQFLELPLVYETFNPLELAETLSKVIDQNLTK